MRLRLSYPSFRDLQNYTTLKQKGGIMPELVGFRDLQNYTTLKPDIGCLNRNFCFRDLQNYTTLKRVCY